MSGPVTTIRGYIILVCRDQQDGWRERRERPARLKAAKRLADAIVANIRSGPRVAKVLQPITRKTLYVSAAGRFGDVFPGSNTS